MSFLHCGYIPSKPAIAALAAEWILSMAGGHHMLQSLRSVMGKGNVSARATRGGLWGCAWLVWGYSAGSFPHGFGQIHLAVTSRSLGFGP